MKILFDISHPAHVHFFKNAIQLLREQSHQVLITSRHKDIATTLLDQLQLQHTPLSRLQKGGLFRLAKELLQRNIALYRIVRRFKPDIMAAIGGVNIAQVGKLCRVPSLVFYDTENAKLQNSITYPFASCVLVPECYQAWLPKKRHIRYNGYHEIAYLHPDYFTADKSLALQNGLIENRDNFFLRLVSWQANHDIGESGWSPSLSRKLIHYLAQRGNVLVSSENPLADDLKQYEYRGDPAQVHHLLAHCRLLIGESATMASEAAVLGVPSLYIAKTGRGYTDEQDRRYGLVKNIKLLDLALILPAIDTMLAQSRLHYQNLGQMLIKDHIDVNRFIIHCLESFPDFLHKFQQQAVN